MKKSLLVMLVGFLAVIFVATDAPFVFAGAVTTGADAVKIDGHIRVRARFRDALDFNRDDRTTESTEYYLDTATGTIKSKTVYTKETDRARLDERIRLGVAADVTPGVKFYVQLERYNDFGTADPLSSTEAGSPNFRAAWIDFAIPDTALNLKLGRQFLTYGHGNTFDSTTYGADALQAYGTFNGVNASLAAVKLRETDATKPGTGDDRDLYALSLGFEPAKGHALEVYILNHRDNDTAVSDTSLATQGSDASGITGGGADEYTIGVAWTGKYGATTAKAELAFQTGTAYTRAADNKDIDREAWGVRAAVDHKIDIFTIGLDFGYGTGQDKDPASTTDRPSEDKGFYQPYYVDGGRWVTTVDVGNPGSFTLGDGTTSRKFTFTGLNNVWFVTLQGTAAVTKTWTLNAFLTHLRAVETYDGMGGPSGKPDKELGWDIGGIANWKPYKNLAVNGYLGLFIPGDYFTSNVTSPKDDNAFIARAEAVVTF